MNKQHWSTVGAGRRAAMAMVAAAGLAAADLAAAGGKIEIDETRWVSLGAGLRTTFRAVEDAADESSYSKEFDVENLRLYLNGQLHEVVKLTVNTELDADEDLRLLDAIARFEFSDVANLWAGRFLPPQDRSGFDGPFFLSSFDFPFVTNYPAIFAGRADGVAAWGQVDGGQFKYQAGVFDAREDGVAGSDDDVLVAGRLTVNLWDPEPGYFNASTYYGAKDILAVGLAGMYQQDLVRSAGGDEGDFAGWNLDALFERKLGNGDVLTIEGAYYDYDLDDIADSDEDGVALIQGESFLVSAAYLFHQTVGYGRFQPIVRYQEFDRDDTNLAGSRGIRERVDVGVNYVIDGHNARIAAMYAEEETEDSDSTGMFLLGLQIQL